MTALHTSTDSLRVTTIDDLLGLVPSLLKFHPEESLVLLAVQQNRVEVTARVDIVGVQTVDGVRVALAGVWRRFPHADYVSVAYAADQEQGWRALESLRLALPPRAGLCALHSDGVRWYADPTDDGTPYDARSSRTAAEATLQGMPVHPSRESLRASVASGRNEALVLAAWRRALGRRVDADALTEEAQALLTASPDLLTADQVALLTLALEQQEFIDDAVLSTCRQNAEQRLAFWAQVVRGVPDECAGLPWVLVGLTGWVSGDGALQVVGVEEAQARGVEDGWVRMLDIVNQLVLPPQHWEEMRLAQLVGAETSGDTLLE